jgi:hypothetical protein
LSIAVSGVTRAEWVPKVRGVVDGWLKSDEPVCAVDGVDIFVVEAEMEQLSGA